MNPINVCSLDHSLVYYLYIYPGMYVTHLKDLLVVRDAGAVPISFKTRKIPTATTYTYC